MLYINSPNHGFPWPLPPFYVRFTHAAGRCLYNEGESGQCVQWRLPSSLGGKACLVGSVPPLIPAGRLAPFPVRSPAVLCFCLPLCVQARLRIYSARDDPAGRRRALSLWPAARDVRAQGRSRAPTGCAGAEESETNGIDQQLLAILEIAKAVATQRDLDALLADSMRSLIETWEAADAAVLLLPSPEDGYLTARAAQGYDPAPLSRIRLAPGESMSGKAFQTGQAQLYATPEATAAAMADMTPANRELFCEATVGLGQPLSAICVPLTTGRGSLGVLVLENMRKPGHFLPDDLTLLQRVGDVIALAIENVRLREELQAAQAISEANRLKAELISTLAHEMRTPLTSIKGYTTALLMEEASFGPETQREFLEIIDQECDLLQDLIRDLLESSIIDAGLLELERQPVMLPRLVNSVIEEIAHRTHRHRFLANFPQDFPIVEADPDRIAQVLRNLLDNAVKYSPEGGLVVIRGGRSQEEVVISVADQGVGIAPEHLNRLFEKFFRIKSGLGRHVVGSGLGLPIARTIVESHGGRIWAESQPGQGTTLYFTLPLHEPGQAAVNGEESQDE